MPLRRIKGDFQDVTLLDPVSADRQVCEDYVIAVAFWSTLTFCGDARKWLLLVNLCMWVKPFIGLRMGRAIFLNHSAGGLQGCHAMRKALPHAAANYFCCAERVFVPQPGTQLLFFVWFYRDS